MVKKKEKIRANEVVLIPHTYDIQWCVNLNRLLGGVFSNPFKIQEPAYMKGRSLLYAMYSKLLPWMRSNGMKAVFFANINYDFIWDVVVAGGVSKVYGFVHGTHAGRLESGDIIERLVPFEHGVFKAADGLFTASEVLKNAIPAPAQNIGLPLYGQPAKPNLSDRIIWPHRLAPDKDYHSLLELPQHIRDRVTVSTPKGGPQVVPLVRPHVGNFYYKPPHQTYLNLARSCGYVLSFAKHETFGYAVLENLWRGAFPIAVDRDNLAYREFLMPEMLISEPAEATEKIAYYDDHPAEREELVRKNQEKLAWLASDQWLERLVSGMGVEW